MSSFGFCLCALLLVLPARAQVPAATSAPTRVIVSTPASGPIVIGGTGQIELDPQIAAALQQSGVDQTVMAQAEFDPPVIPAGGHSTYRVVLTAMIEGASLPDKLPTPAGLELKSTSRGFAYAGVGGAMQPRTTLNYRAAVKGPGVYVLPSFIGSGNGKPVPVPEARLTVLPPEMPPPPRTRPWLLAEVPPGEYYIGQAVPVSVILLDPGDKSVLGPGQPQVTGDAFVTDPAPIRVRGERRNAEGRSVDAYITELTVTPVSEGRQSLTAQEQAIWNHPPGNGGISLPGYYPLLDSEPVTVTIKHLPKEGELPGFTGGIGTFRLDPPKVSTNLTRAGDPLLLTVTVRGEGNLSRLLPPRLDSTNGWQIFTPASDGASPVQIQQRGAAVFVYTLIPLNDRVEATPAIPFSYFNPAEQKYMDLTIPPVGVRVLPPLNVVAAPANPAPAADAGRPPVEPEISMTALAETPGRSASSLVPAQERAGFLGAQLAPALTLGALWGWRRRRRFLEQHPQVVLRARARRGLRRQLRLARRAAAAHDASGFVTAAVNALRDASAPRAAANPGALVCADVLESLPPGRRDGNEDRLIRTLFSATDSARFVNKAHDSAALLALQPELERLLAKWKESL